MLIYHAKPVIESIREYWKYYPGARLNIMLTYANRDRHMEQFCFDYRNQLNSIMLDSGTFTKNSNPKKYEHTITPDGHKAFLRTMAGRVDHYYSFDESFAADGFETNLRNQLDLEAAGFKPIPVIHDCKGPEIPYYIDNNYKYVSIGSGELAYAPVDKLKRIVMNLYQHGIKVHFLGSTNFIKLASAPVFSCDSSTWNQAGLRGKHINFWNPRRMRRDKTDNVYLNRDFLDSYPFRQDFEDYIYQAFGFYIDDLIDTSIPNAIRKLNIQVLNIHYFVEIERIINEIHQAEGYVF
jgi:hypothetical protein